MKSNVLNFILYEAGWLASVLGVNSNRPVAGSLVALALIAVHLLLVKKTLLHIKLMSFAIVLGVMVESALAYLQVYELAHSSPGSLLPPIWIGVLWLQFATLMPFTLRWLSERYWLATFSGLIGGPLAFLAGERLSVVTFASPKPLSLCVLGAGWSLSVLVLTLACDCCFGRFDGLRESYRWVDQA